LKPIHKTTYHLKQHKISSQIITLSITNHQNNHKPSNKQYQTKTKRNRAKTALLHSKDSFSFILDLEICVGQLEILSGESERGEGVEEKGRKKKIKKRSFYLRRGRVELAGHRAGTGHPAGEEDRNSRERAEPLSLERGKREKEIEK